MQKRLKMALERQKVAAEKKSTHQQHQQKQAEGLMPRMKVRICHLASRLQSHFDQSTLKPVLSEFFFKKKTPTGCMSIWQILPSTELSSMIMTINSLRVARKVTWTILINSVPCRLYLKM